MPDAKVEVYCSFLDAGLGVDCWAESQDAEQEVSLFTDCPHEHVAESSRHDFDFAGYSS
jgi:hypothetical protein